MFGSNCCFLTCVQISQKAGKVALYNHLLKHLPQFVVIHIVKGFGIVNKSEVDVLLEFSCFFYDPEHVGNLISGSSAFSKSSLNIWKFLVHVLLNPCLENFLFFFSHPEPPSLLPPHTIPLGHPSAPDPSIQHPALNLDCRLISYMIVYVFQCHSPKSSQPLPLPQSP